MISQLLEIMFKDHHNTIVIITVIIIIIIKEDEEEEEEEEEEAGNMLYILYCLCIIYKKNVKVLKCIFI